MTLQRGLKVKAVGTNQLTILAEIEAEIYASVKQVGEMTAMSSSETKISARPEQLTGLTGIRQRLESSRGMGAISPSIPNFPSWTP